MSDEFVDRLRADAMRAPIRFDRWMDACLYDPAGGFYSTGGAAGRRGGDFVTSPEVGPLFGELLVDWVGRCWAEVGRPGSFDVVDAGAGRGALTISMMAAVEGPLARAVRWVTVERSAALRDRQREYLDGRVRIVDAVPPRIDGVVIANELLDNLPVRIARRVGDDLGDVKSAASNGWREVAVAWDEVARRFAPVTVPIPDDRDGDRFSATLSSAPYSELGVDVTVPIYSAAAGWVERARERLRGRLLCIDYGAPHLAEIAARDGDWLRTYSSHERGSDPFGRPGQVDITVDIAADAIAAEAQVGVQSAFLDGCGLRDLVATSRAVSADPSSLRSLDGLRHRSRLVEVGALCDPDGLGGFLVLDWPGRRR